MANIYGRLEREDRSVTLGDNNKLDCSINVGSARDIEGFMDVVVTKDDKDFKATLGLHGNKEFMLCVDKEDDLVLVKSMVGELKDWLISCDYEDIFGLLEELKGLEVTLSTYLEDIYRAQE